MFFSQLLAVLLCLKMNPLRIESSFLKGRKPTLARHHCSLFLTGDQLSRVLHVPRATAQRFLNDAFGYLVTVVNDINWEDRLSTLNHCSHFPYFVSFFVKKGKDEGWVLKELKFVPSLAADTVLCPLTNERTGHIVCFPLCFAFG